MGKLKGKKGLDLIVGLLLCIDAILIILFLMILHNIYSLTDDVDNLERELLYKKPNKCKCIQINTSCEPLEELKEPET